MSLPQRPCLPQRMSNGRHHNALRRVLHFAWAHLCTAVHGILLPPTQAAQCVLNVVTNTLEGACACCIVHGVFLVVLGALLPTQAFQCGLFPPNPTGAGPSTSASSLPADAAAKVAQIKEVMGDAFGDGFLHACLHAYKWEPEQVWCVYECVKCSCPCAVTLACTLHYDGTYQDVEHKADLQFPIPAIKLAFE
eukprot:scaffold200652_cov18-Tisochrysis_lutea.AAC.1